MELIHKSAAQGKTSDLIKLAVQRARNGEHVYFVTLNRALAKFMFSAFTRDPSYEEDVMGFNHITQTALFWPKRSAVAGVIEFIAAEHLTHTRIPEGKVVLLDNADLILQSIFNGQIKAATWTKTEEDAQANDSSPERIPEVDERARIKRVCDYFDKHVFGKNL